MWMIWIHGLFMAGSHTYIVQRGHSFQWGMNASPHRSPAGTRGRLLKIVLPNVVIFCALCQEVQLCLYWSLFTVMAQSVFLGQPGLSVPTHHYGQAVFTVLCLTWFSDFCLWSRSNRVLEYNFCLGPNRIAFYFCLCFPMRYVILLLPIWFILISGAFSVLVLRC